MPSPFRAGFGLLALFLAVAAAGLWLRDRLTEGPDDALAAFLDDWSAGDDREAADRTDSPAAARAALAANRRGLDGARLDAEQVEVDEDGDAARARVKLTWRVPGFGDWSYETRVLLRRDGDWTVHWAPTLVHPKLDRDTRLGTTRTWPERAPILGGDRRPIVRNRPVAHVGLVKSEVRDPRRSATELAELLDVDARRLRRALRGAGPEQFVPALTLRRDDYRRMKTAVDAVPDVTVVEAEAPLAPSREFARALIGAVAPATAEQLKELGRGYRPGDEVGQWGLQARFERRLAGAPSHAIVIRARGVPIETLDARAGRRGEPLRTTLDARVQAAAEAALGDRTDEAAIVALQPSSGNVLAVANRPLESTFDRALEGTYAPGSTFKVITTAALLRDGLDPDETVDCPSTIDVGGRQFRNFEGGAAGAVPFSQDFAESCNTAFVSLAGRLAATALRDTARDFGLGPRPRLGMPAAAASVPPGRSDVERAAAMIGQHRIVASPLAMAGVAGTVAAGRWHAPRLLADDPRDDGPELDAGEVETLRTLMRSVVTSGTGTALVGVPGEVSGKSGTAEFGSGDPPPTHAWFIAFRDDLAVAVLVENGESGGSVAAPIAAAFFESLGG